MKKIIALALLVGWVKIISAYLVYGVHSGLYLLRIDGVSKSAVILLFAMFIYGAGWVRKSISVWCFIISIFHLYVLLPIHDAAKVMVVGKPLFVLSIMFFFVLTIYSIFVRKSN